MSWPADYHMHTPLCGHASGEPTDYAAQAVQAGLSEIGFSEHAPMIRDDCDDWHMSVQALDDYVQRVEKARRDHPQLIIRLALEIDFIPGQEPWIRDLAARHPWDYLIGSVHYLWTDWNFDNPAQKDLWQKRDPTLIWREYLDCLWQAADSGLFDILAHPDLCKKFAIYPTEDCTPLFRRALSSARRQGMAMELNTAGLRQPCQEIYPSPTLVRLAAELGLPITFGSDAHAPRQVGADFRHAVHLARQAGFTQYRRYHRRRHELVSLTVS